MRTPIRNLRWIIAALVFLNTVVNYVDRQTLSVLAPTLTRLLHLSQIEYANIVQAFLISYTVMYVPAGLAFDRWGVKRVLGAATVWWSAAAILPVFARSAWQLGASRFLLGIGEAFTFIGATAVAAEWYPAKERALLGGMANAAAVTGAIATPPLVVWIFLNWGWKTAFLVTGFSGFAWVALWCAWYNQPQKHKRISREELALLEQEAGAEQGKPPSSAGQWLRLLGMRQTWGLLSSRVFSDPVWWFYLFWLPKYLAESRGMSMAQIGMVVWVPYLASDIGSLAGGWASGLLIRRGWEVLRARRFIMLLSVSVMPLGIAVAYARSSAIAITLVCVVLFAHMSWKTNQMTLTVDAFPRHVVASVAGIVGAGGGIGAALFTSLAGHLIERYSYLPVFWVMGFMHPLSFLFIHWLVRERPLTRPAV